MNWQQHRETRSSADPTGSRSPATKRTRGGAKTRKGTPCRARGLRGSARCKLHGGMSTGPKTQEGRKRIAQAQRIRWAKWRSERQQPDVQTPMQPRLDIGD